MARPLQYDLAERNAATPQEMTTMTDIRTLTAAQLLARAELPIDSEGGPDGLTTFLQHAATMTENPALSLLFSVLSEEPPEVAAGWAHALEEMAVALHPDDNYGPTLARAVANALVHWKQED